MMALPSYYERALYNLRKECIKNMETL
jgi:hypothetical protein